LPEGIELLYLDDLPALAIKLKVERATPRARFLLYSAKPVPDPASDWLLDIRLRSRSFHADNASILLEDLGLTSQQLRAHLKERAKFLKSKDRVDRLKRWVTPNDAAGDLDRKMIAVLAKSRASGSFRHPPAAFLCPRPGRRRQSGCRTESVLRHRRQ
jgi:hypothetical protein